MVCSKNLPEKGNSLGLHPDEGGDEGGLAQRCRGAVANTRVMPNEGKCIPFCKIRHCYGINLQEYEHASAVVQI